MVFKFHATCFEWKWTLKAALGELDYEAWARLGWAFNHVLGSNGSCMKVQSGYVRLILTDEVL